MTHAAEIRRLLICENRGKPGMRVAAELQKSVRVRPIEIETAASAEAARRLLQTRSFAVAVIDVGRESGEAQALLRTIGNGFPSLPLFVFNGFLIPGIAEKAREYARIQYCEDPRELDRFVALIEEELSDKKKGTIEGILLSNLLEWLEHEKLSGQVVVSNGGRKGILFLREGRLTSARRGGEQGGRTALAEISSWEKVTVEIKEGSAPEGTAPRPAPPARRRTTSASPARVPGSGASDIETLRLVRGGHILDFRIRELKRTIESIRGVLGEALLRADIFLSADGRSLAGWNSHPLACSSFAAITRVLVGALAGSGFPALGNYYLIDLAEGKLALVLVCGELQMGMLLAREHVHMGLLTNIVLPDAAKALSGSHAVGHPA
jgi:ActR/RegA family two-component response regulator